MPNPIKNPPKSILDTLYRSYLEAGLKPASARAKICEALSISERAFYTARASGSLPPSKTTLLQALIALGTL